MSGFPTVPSRAAVGVDWDMGTVAVANTKTDVTDAQLNLLAWQACGLGVGAGSLVWALIQGSDGSRLSGGECWNPNGNPSLSLVLATAWAGTTAYGLGAMVSLNGALFRVIVGGTSAGSGGPTGTGNAIVDGSVTWAYVSTGGYCSRLSTGVYQLAFQASYPDETGTLVPLNLQVAKAFPQTSSKLLAVANVAGVNTINVDVFDLSGTATDCNFAVEAR